MADDENGLIPPGSLTTTTGLLNWVLKKPSEYNIFGSKNVFQAKVLTPPRSTDASGKSVCMVRILDPAMAHMKLLRDPCDISISSDPALVSFWQSLHTKMIIEKAGAASDDLGENDIVDIILEPSGHGNAPYDLQTGKFLKLTEKSSTIDVDTRPKCLSVVAGFDDMGPSVLSGGDAHTGTQLAGLDESDEYVSIFPKNKTVTITPAITNFLQQLQKQILKSEIDTIIVTSGLRTARAQAWTSYNKRLKDGDEALLILYSQKDLVNEALAVENTVEAMAAVYQSQMDRGKYLSKHMRGSGVDFRISNLTPPQWEIITTRANALGVKSFYEESKAGDHIHTDIPSSFNS